MLSTYSARGRSEFSRANMYAAMCDSLDGSKLCPWRFHRLSAADTCDLSNATATGKLAPSVLHR